jgi:Uma2 family endonuclease
MVAKIDPLMTVDDLDAMPEDSNRYEVIEGELFVSRAPGLPHQIVSGNIQYQLRDFLDKNPIGRVIATPGLIFSQYSGVIPDLVFYSHDRGKEIIANDRLNAAPEIVIEILSSGRENISRDRVAKRQLYAKHAVSEYWIVDSENRSVEVYRLANQSLELADMLSDNDEITSPSLPGFGCPLSKIFES